MLTSDLVNGGRDAALRARLAVAALGFSIFCLVVIPSAVAGSATAPASCTREDFEDVVDEAGNKLRDLNRENKPKFQDQLRRLKDARGWDHTTFLEQAKPFVSDDAITDFDRSSSQLLSEIASLGSVNASETEPDCAVLVELRARMTVLVKTQSEKWTYMFTKLNKALSAGGSN